MGSNDQRGDVHHAALQGEQRRSFSTSTEIKRVSVLDGQLATPVARSPTQGAGEPPLREISQTVEGMLVSKGGGVLVIGWIDDTSDPVDEIRVSSGDWRVTIGGETLGRTRRPDAEAALGANIPQAYGYYGFVFTGQTLILSDACKVEIVLRSGYRVVVQLKATLIQDLEIREIVLSYICASQHLGNAQIKAIEGVDRGAAVEILKLNRALTKSVVASPYVERFGRAGRTYDGSIIVCLYGKSEFLFLQAALYANVRGIDRYEFIYVSNSPELAEALLREAKAASFIYGLDITVVLLSGNAGFGAANNVAAHYARSDRILIVNPDVFPIDEKWAHQHSALLEDNPQERTRMFGAALYYDDGSLMHGGMFFEIDRGVSLDNGRHRAYQLARVEHYGKGTPPEMTTFTRSRPVPAITGAFMSCSRSWFEQLGGFTEDYVFGHYEDADLCLKSLQAGSPVWLLDLKLWHLEGKGSTRLPVHEGGSLINRWLFSATWGETLSRTLIGPEPSHPAFAADAAPLTPLFKSRLSVLSRRAGGSSS